jgi:hypothetical protein
MHLALLTSILAFCATKVAADGVITFCKGANGGSCLNSLNLGRPGNCSGGCVGVPGTKSVKQFHVDSGYCCKSILRDVICVLLGFGWLTLNDLCSHGVL